MLVAELANVLVNALIAALMPRLSRMPFTQGRTARHNRWSPLAFFDEAFAPVGCQLYSAGPDLYFGWRRRLHLIDERIVQMCTGMGWTRPVDGLD